MVLIEHCTLFKRCVYFLGSGSFGFGCVDNDMIWVGMLGLLELKLNTAQLSSLKLLKVRLHIVDLNGFIFAKELTSKILSQVGGGGGMD